VSPAQRSLTGLADKKLRRILRRIFMFKSQKEKGVTIVEYAIMLALIAIAIAVAAPNITSAVVSVFSRASSVMN
jgi:Flp pilus assembly pilin Flp